MSSSTCSGRAASAPGIDRDEDTSDRVRLHEETFTGSLSGASKNLPGNTEHEAWSLIDSLQVEDILTSLPPRSISNLPLCLRSLFQDCCSIPLRKIENDPSNDVGWKLLFLLPRMLLQPHVCGGKVGIREVKARYQRFLNFHWKELIHLKNVTARKQPSYGDNRRKTALRLVQADEMS